MNIMNFRNFIMGTAVFLGLILAACSTSQDPTVENGTGRISLGVTTSTAFSRAVTERTTAMSIIILYRYWIMRENKSKSFSMVKNLKTLP